MPPTWTLRSPDPEHVEHVSRIRRVHRLVASLLVSRGHTEGEAIERHLNAGAMHLHDPDLLPGMEAATARVQRAIEEGETILIHGDYDVDGVTGTVLLVRMLRRLGADVRWHIPNRLVDGYSFGAHSVARAKAEGATLGISVDNGTSAYETITELLEAGVDTVVTDHHEPPAGSLPPASAIVNPKLHDSAYPWRELCGGAVAFKLAWAVARRMSGGGKVSPELNALLQDATALVAIATVCDVVPLLDENRAFARFGLRALEATTNPGLRALVDVAGIGGRALTAEDVAFQIGPRINASGRLGAADQAVELLLAEDETQARNLARALDDLNQERRAIERDVLEEARAAAARYADADAHPVLVLAGQGWHQGVVGIVAARLVEEFHRPAVVIGLDGDEGRGSARSVDGFSILEALNAAAPHFDRHGGHAAAAGCEIRADQVDAARAAIEERACAMLAEAEAREAELLIDFDLPFPEMTADLMRQVDPLEPFGQSNEKPVLLSRAVHVAEPPRRVGADRSHLMLRLRVGSHALRAMAFGMGARAEELTVGMPLDTVYTPRWNTFRGETNLELLLHDFRAAGG
jgi:single-stranded-DNA-specific exonuclease